MYELLVTICYGHEMRVDVNWFTNRVEDVYQNVKNIIPHKLFYKLHIVISS